MLDTHGTQELSRDHAPIRQGDFILGKTGTKQCWNETLLERKHCWNKNGKRVCYGPAIPIASTNARRTSGGWP